MEFIRGLTELSSCNTTEVPVHGKHTGNVGWLGPTLNLLSAAPTTIRSQREMCPWPQSCKAFLLQEACLSQMTEGPENFEGGAQDCRSQGESVSTPDTQFPNVLSSLTSIYLKTPTAEDFPTWFPFSYFIIARHSSHPPRIPLPYSSVCKPLGHLTKQFWNTGLHGEKISESIYFL